MAKTTAKGDYDSIYFLKILLYLILGSVWIAGKQNPIIPVGIIAGILIARHERLMIDRKIEYAMLLIGGVLGLVGIGVIIHI